MPMLRPDAKVASDIVFYQLGTKFVDNEREIDHESDDLMYYSLSVGHHVGVIDCFEEKFRCGFETYLEVLGVLPEGSDVRYKLEGIPRRGEIQVDKTHLVLLEQGIAGIAGPVREALSPEAQAWLASFEASLEAMKRQPAIYLMGRLVQR